MDRVRKRWGTWRWAWLALALLVHAPIVSAGGGPTREPARVRPPLVVVRSIGPVDPEHLRSACRSLLAAYPVRCEIRARRTLMELASAWDETREQLEGRAALELLFRDRPRDAVAEIDVTQLDLYEAPKPFVFGLASLTDRVAIVSLARLGLADPPANARLRKLVLHEAGHALGLHHHDHDDCVMRQDPTLQSLDTAPEALCRRCHTRLVRNLGVLARPGRSSLDRARGHLARGEREAARQELVRSLVDGRRDPELLEAFAMAFLDAGHYDESISVLAYVARMHPDRARVRANLGLAYQLRGRNGDRERAIDELREALRLRPDWRQPIGIHLEALQAREPSAQGPDR